MDKLKTDFHNHTNKSYCAREEMSVINMIRSFEKNGLEQAGISDHLYPDKNFIEYFHQTKREVEELKSHVKVYVGTEVDVYYPGRLSVDKEALKEFDYIIISCTHYQNRGKVIPPINFDDYTIAQNMVDFMLFASTVEYADIIGHPFHATGLEIYDKKVDLAKIIGLIPDNTMRYIAKNMKKNKIAMEINSVVMEKDYGQAMQRIYSICKEERVKFSLGSDAHWLDSMYEIPLISDYLSHLHIEDKDIWTM